MELGPLCSASLACLFEDINFVKIESPRGQKFSYDDDNVPEL